MSQQQRQRAVINSPPPLDAPETVEHVRPAEKDDAVIEIGRPISSGDPYTRKCWICFEEEGDAEISAHENNSNWVNPCRCSLIAHEDCLLTWVDETQKMSESGPNSSRTIKCPQCKEPYTIKSKNSLSVSLMTTADNWITKALFATIPLGALKAVGITCFYYGQGAMLDVLGEERLTDLLLSLKPGDEIRYVIGASCIPFALVGSRFDLFNFVLPLLPSLVCFSDTSFIQSKRPMDSSPALWICVLPWLRNLYCFSWRLCLGPLERRWQAEAGLLQKNVTEVAPGIAIREVPPEEIQELQLEEEQQGEPRDLVAHDDQEMDQEEDAMAERWIFVEAPKLARLVAGALLLPKIAMLAGRLLDRVPPIKKRYPHRFQKVIIGGLTFIVMKDLLSLVFLYSRAKGRTSRHIMNKKALR